MTLETLGSRLRYARKCRRYKPEWLCEVLGIAYQKLQGWENGERPLRHEHLRVLAYYLEVPIVWLVTGGGEPPCRPLTAAERIMAEVDIGPRTRLLRLQAAMPTASRLPDL